MEEKKQELEVQRQAEERILREAEKRRQEGSSGSGETPPPLPSVPPPVESPVPTGAHRLDMLVGGGVLKSTPAKKVSFVTDAKHEEDEEEDKDNGSQGQPEVYDSNDNINKTPEDPNVRESSSLPRELCLMYDSPFAEVHQRSRVAASVLDHGLGEAGLQQEHGKHSQRDRGSRNIQVRIEIRLPVEPTLSTFSSTLAEIPGRSGCRRPRRRRPRASSETELSSHFKRR